MARAALEQLDLARNALEAAETARDRARALTETVLAYEDGLDAMREGLRRAAIREAQLRGRLAGRDAEITALTGVLLSLPQSDAPTAFLHPDGPLGTVRAGMLLAELAPGLNDRVVDLRRDLEDVQSLVLLQRQAATRLEAGLDEVRAARVALNKAIADRTDLPRRFTADPERMARLLASAETLDAFSSGLVDLQGAGSEVDVTLGPVIGDIALPVRGVVLRGPGEADAAGITRPGLLLATRAGALVTSPVAATIRYSGPLLEFGQAVILEPAPEVLFIFAGLASTYGTAGEVVGPGAALGLMGGLATGLAQIPTSTGGEGGGTGRRETLYIEVRQENEPQDPTRWFRTDEDG